MLIIFLIDEEPEATGASCPGCHKNSDDNPVYIVCCLCLIHQIPECLQTFRVHALKEQGIHTGCLEEVVWKLSCTAWVLFRLGGGGHSGSQDERQWTYLNGGRWLLIYKLARVLWGVALSEAVRMSELRALEERNQDGVFVHQTFTHLMSVLFEAP